MWCKCIPSEGDKFPEAAFRAVVYTVGWGWTAYVTFNHDYFHSPYKTLHGQWFLGITTTIGYSINSLMSLPTYICSSLILLLRIVTVD